MRHSLAVSLLLAGLVGGACAAQKQYNPPAQQMVPFESHVNMGPTSSGSSSFRSSAGAGAGDDDYSEEFSGGGKGLSVPRRGRNVDSIEFVARPDVLTAEFAVREVRPTSNAALDAAKASSAAVLAQLAQATGGAASTKLRGMTIAKVVRKKQFVGVSVTVDGLLEVRRTARQWVRPRPRGLAETVAGGSAPGCRTPFRLALDSLSTRSRPLADSSAYNRGMEKPEKPPPPDPTCPICKGPAHFARAVNARVEFWECETKHMFVVDKKPPPKVAAGAAAAAAAAPAAAPAPAPAEPPPAAPGEAESKPT